MKANKVEFHLHVPAYIIVDVYSLHILLFIFPFMLPELILIIYNCRCELPQPATGKMTDVQAWLESVHNSEAQLEHQALR